MLKEMGTGLLVTEADGAGVNIVNGDCSRGAAGFWVENGGSSVSCGGDHHCRQSSRHVPAHIVAVGSDGMSVPASQDRLRTGRADETGALIPSVRSGLWCLMVTSRSTHFSASFASNPDASSRFWEMHLMRLLLGYKVIHCLSHFSPPAPAPLRALPVTLFPRSRCILVTVMVSVIKHLTPCCSCND